MNIFVCKKAFLRRLVKKQNVFRDIMKMFCLECSLLFTCNSLCAVPDGRRAAKGWGGSRAARACRYGMHNGATFRS